MGDILEGVGSALSQAGKFFVKGAWEGAKIGYKTGKIMGKSGGGIVKETAKGAWDVTKEIGKSIK